MFCSGLITPLTNLLSLARHSLSELWLRPSQKRWEGKDGIGDVRRLGHRRGAEEKRQARGTGRKKHPFANHPSQAMKFLRLGASQVHFKEKCWREKVSLKADIYERWQFANISILDKAVPVTQRSAAKLDESAANIYFIRTCPVSADGLIVWGERASVGLILPVTLSQFAWICPKRSNKYVKKDKKKNLEKLCLQN